LAHFRVAHLKTLPVQRSSQITCALARPTQRRLRITACTRLDDRLQGFDQPRLLLLTRLASTALTSLAIRWQGLRSRKLLNTIANRAVGQGGRRRHRGNAAPAQRPGLSSCPAPSAALVQVWKDGQILLTNPLDN